MARAALRILLILLAGCCLPDARGQADLVRWNNTGYTPTPVASNITASNITVAGGVTLSHESWGDDNNFFQMGNWPSGGMTTTKYVEFTIAPNTGYKIDLDKFNFYYRAQGTPQNYEIRYSKDDFATYYTSIGSTSANGSWTSVSAGISSVNPVMPGQIVKIRIYVSNTYNNFHIKRLLNAGSPTNYSQTPTITGTVSPAVTADPTDLGVTQTMSNTTPNTGDNVTFIITAENHGPNAATGTSVTDLLPAGFSYVSHTASTGTYQPGSGTWTIGSLANGATATLQITTTKQPTGPYTNTATISHYGSDANTSNDSYSITPGNACANCTHIISGSTITVNPGETYCLHAGSWAGGVKLNAGGTICIGEGATFKVDYVIGNGAVNGTIINRGTVSAFPTENADNYVTIENYGTFTTNGLKRFAGTIQNYGTINNSGETSFLPGGSMLNTGNYTTSQISGLSGMLENQGTLTNTGGTIFSDGGNMINSGNYSAATFQNFSGTLENMNSGVITIAGDVSFQSGAEIVNHGNIQLGTLSSTNAGINNDSNATFTVNNGVNVYSGHWNNRPGGNIKLKGSNINFNGDADNSGYWEFERISSLSSTLNNYGWMKVYNAASNLSAATYLTNDSLLEFINVPEVQFNGPMLTNNGRLTVSHGTTGNFKMNQAINRTYNNGIIIISGQFEQNAAGSKLVNNCRIVCKTFFVGNGDVTNNGLIWATGNGTTEARRDGINIEGTGSNFYNAKTGFVRGANFRNSGDIKGYGNFYFTEYTDANTNGTIKGNSADTPILFFDASQTGSNIFDASPQNTSLIQNVLRPGAMTVIDTNTMDCGGILLSVTGYPPHTDTVHRSFCTAAPLAIDLHNYVTPYDNSFTIQYNTIKLFEYNNTGNPTNNTTSLVIAGKGTFSANTTTGIITFTPDPGFTNGSVSIQYQVSNTRAGDPVVYPGAKTGITITAGSGGAPPQITVGTF